MLPNISSKISSCHQLLLCFTGIAFTTLLLLGRRIILGGNILVLLQELLLYIKISNCTHILLTGSNFLAGRHLYTHIHVIIVSNILKSRNYFLHICIFIMSGIFSIPIHLFVDFQLISLTLSNMCDIFVLDVPLHFNDFFFGLLFS